MSDTLPKALQIAPRNNFPAAADLDSDGLERWRDLYFEVEVTTAASSRRVQQRDIA